MLYYLVCASNYFPLYGLRGPCFSIAYTNDFIEEFEAIMLAMRNTSKIGINQIVITLKDGLFEVDGISWAIEHFGVLMLVWAAKVVCT